MNNPKTHSAPDIGGTGAQVKTRKPQKSPRRRARELALQALYQWRVCNADEADVLACLPDLEGYKKADKELCLSLTRAILREHQAFSEAFSGHLDRKFSEVSPIESIILLMATCELVHFPETPYRVIINEAIELTKVFGGEDSHRYINGVLDKTAAKIRPAETAMPYKPA